jgi:hypothetical protein
MMFFDPLPLCAAAFLRSPLFMLAFEPLQLVCMLTPKRLELLRVGALGLRLLLKPAIL